jgi:hypothetical protein
MKKVGRSFAIFYFIAASLDLWRPISSDATAKTYATFP